jgi:hypothetical protein
MYFLRARYYNSNTGRFFSADSFEGRLDEPESLHRYLYASDNPIDRVDPSGNLDLVETVVVAGIIGAEVGAFAGYMAGGWRGALWGGIGGAVLSGIVAAGVFAAAPVVAAGLGVSVGTGFFITGMTVNLLFMAANLYQLSTASSERQKIALQYTLIASLAAAVLGASFYFGAKAGSGTFVNQDPNASQLESDFGRWIADKEALDLVKQPGGDDPTPDYRIRFGGGTLELKDQTATGSIGRVVSNILKAQGDDVAILVRPGQFTDAEINSIPGRVFGPNAPSQSINTVRVVYQTGSGFQYGPVFTRR